MTAPKGSQAWIEQMLSMRLGQNVLVTRDMSRQGAIVLWAHPRIDKGPAFYAAIGEVIPLGLAWEQRDPTHLDLKAIRLQAECDSLSQRHTAAVIRSGEECHRANQWRAAAVVLIVANVVAAVLATVWGWS